MIARSSFIMLMAGSALILIGVNFLGNQALYGALIGYWVGFVYTEWIYRETVRSSRMELKQALRRVRWGTLGRFGAVTIIVIAVARFHKDWLFFMAVGIAIGMILSIITVAIHMIRNEGGDK